MESAQRKTFKFLDRALIGGVVFVVLLLAGVEIARSAEILPSIGMARPAKGGDSRLYTGIALRTGLAPFIQSEIGVAYRKEQFSTGGVNATTWPVTGSLWLAPIPFAYAGGGVGWYHTSFSYPGVPLSASAATTQQSFGTHVGGGLRMPLAPMVGLDLNARYVSLSKSSDSTIPTGYDPKFWSAALGLGVKF